MTASLDPWMSESEVMRGVLVIEDFFGNALTVPLPLGRPMALTVGLLGVEVVVGNTQDKKLEAGDGGMDENGEDISEWVGDIETGGGGRGGGGGRSLLDGEGRLLVLRNGGGGGGKVGELGDSMLPALLKRGMVTLPKVLCEVVGDRGEERLDPEESDDWLTMPDPPGL